ncbi:MAG: hypothetical protein IJU56_08485 [Clostridia bacterium]|nr:hypothetical protein [Clostridia bacterium]
MDRFSAAGKRLPLRFFARKTRCRRAARALHGRQKGALGALFGFLRMQSALCAAAPRPAGGVLSARSVPGDSLGM